MKRLANLKNSNSSSSSPAGTSSSSSNKRGGASSKKNSKLNNPYPLSGTVREASHHHTSSRNDQDSLSGAHGRPQSPDPSLTDLSAYDNQVPPATSAKSTAPTLSTTGETALSDAAYSKAGTMATTAGGGISSAGGGEGSTFSSPAPSVRSLTTTLTTVQSTAPSAHIYGTHNNNNAHHHGLSHVNSTHSAASQQTGVQFTHQFPSSPVSAVPSHLAPHGHPMTYSTATANNLLTDNASILTLASSSKRRRRNSLDTNASIRALAPSSIFGGSRESLPLSVLSGNVGGDNRGLASAERSSVYSSTGGGAAGTGLSSSAGGDRGSFYAANSINNIIDNKSSGGGGAATATTDGSSVRSSSHVRNDSAGGSIAGNAAGPPSATTGRASSRRNSGWGEQTAVDDSDGELEGETNHDKRH